MIEPTYELNVEKLQSLSIADLTGLWNYAELNICSLEKLNTPNALKQVTSYWGIILHECSSELEKRINDIIIF